jgi:hypothetical protein
VLSSRIASFLSSAPAPEALAKTMNAVGRPGIAAILPLEGAVLAGRSASEAKRSGFLGFQERFIEEIVVAAVWLKGVKVLGNLFDKFHTLDTSVDWSAKKLASVDLTPLERYTSSPSSANNLMRVKGLRFLFSVASTLFILGVAIPWLNQLKTKWIIDKYFHKPHPQKQSNPQKSKPQTPQLEGFSTALTKPLSSPRSEARNSIISNQDWEKRLASQPALKPSPPETRYAAPHIASPKTNGPIFPAAPYYHQPLNALPPIPQLAPPSQWIPLPAAQFQTNQNQTNQWQNVPYQQAPYSRQPSYTHQPSYTSQPYRPLQFGAGLPIGNKLLAKAGHIVENTDYGSILVTDLGIMAGRGAVAAKRSPFEALEIWFRDGLSMYFYILSVPHLMTLMDKLMKPTLQSAINLDPAAASAVKNKLVEGIHRLGAATLTKSQLTQLIEGKDIPVTNHPELAHWMTSLPLQTPQGEGFLKALELELKATLNTPQQPQRAEAVFNSLKTILPQLQSPDGRLGTKAFSSLLDGISSGKLPSSDLSALQSLSLNSSEAQTVLRSLKNAFRHHAGMEAAHWQSGGIIRPFLEKVLPEAADHPALLERLNRISEADTADLMNSLFRRGLLLSENGLKEDHQARAHLVSNWLESAANRKLSFQEVAREVLEETKQEIAQLKALPESLKPSLKQLQEMLGSIRASATSAAPFEAIRNHLKQSPNKLHQDLASKLFTFEYLFINHPHFEQGADGLLKLVFNDLKDVAPTEANKSLMSHYQKLLERLTQKESKRIFSLFTNLEGAEVQQKLTEMIQGGLRHDSRLVRAALKDVGTLVASSKQYPQTGKIQEMEKHLAEYLQTFVKHLEKGAAQGWHQSVGTISKEKLFSELERFVTKSQNSRYLAQWVAIPATMIGLGILVPKLQFWLTRYLTGKDGHPGIDAVSHLGEAETSTNAPTLSEGETYVPLIRSGFQAFQR